LQFNPTISPEFGIKDISPGKAIMWAYVGISAGDLMRWLSPML
jgi:hypothetical protein